MVFRAIWAVAKNFFDPNTQKKLVLSGDQAVFGTKLDKVPDDLAGTDPASTELTSKEIITYAEKCTELWEEEEKEA